MAVPRTQGAPRRSSTSRRCCRGTSIARRCKREALRRADGYYVPLTVKELRLRGISTPEAANAYLPEFLSDYRGPSRGAASALPRLLRQGLVRAARSHRGQQEARRHAGSDPGSPAGTRPAASGQPEPHAAAEEPDSGRPGASRRSCPRPMSGLRPPPTRHFYFAEHPTFLNWFDNPPGGGICPPMTDLRQHRDATRPRRLEEHRLHDRQVAKVDHTIAVEISISVLAKEDRFHDSEIAEVNDTVVV